MVGRLLLVGLLGLVLPWLGQAIPAFPYLGKNQLYPAGSRYTDLSSTLGSFYTSLERRVAAIESASMQQVNARLEALEAAVNNIGGEQCQTNKVKFQICQDFEEADTASLLACVAGPISSGEPTVNTVTVPFNPPFQTGVPTVNLALSGQAIFTAKNCSTVIDQVTQDSFTFTFTGDNFLPVDTELTWYACPGALFAPGEGVGPQFNNGGDGDDDGEDVDDLFGDVFIDPSTGRIWDRK